MPRKRTRAQELEALAEEMTAVEIWDAIQQLGRDDRFAAVFGWLKRSEEAWKLKVVQPEQAGNHGLLASHAGSVGALVRLRSQLAEKLRKTRETPATTPGD